MRNTADVSGGKPIAVLLQFISGVSTINPLVAFYDIYGEKRVVLFFYFVPDTTYYLFHIHVHHSSIHLIFLSPHHMSIPAQDHLRLDLYNYPTNFNVVL
jgi:hypothetical protein